jgi:NRAMP (natural resistance-associated macrophage protein)-like metal ion transporter
MCSFQAMILEQPDYSELAKGLIIPQLGSKRAAALYASIATLGSAVMPHNIVLGSSLVLTRRVNRQERKAVDEAVRFFTLETSITLLLTVVRV